MKRGELEHKIFKEFKLDDKSIQAVKNATRSIETEPNPKIKMDLISVFVRKDMLLNNFAELGDENFPHPYQSFPFLTWQPAAVNYSWTLVRRYTDYRVPDDILRAIRMTYLFSFKNSSCVPHFIKLKRQLNIVQLEATTYEYSLRSMIGSKPRMKARGQTIIRNLLLGLNELLNLNVAIRNIQPSNIFIKEDGSELIF